MLRMTMFFETDNYTWTESHWFSALTTYAAGVAPAAAIAVARNALLGDYAAIAAVRLTNPALPRTSFYLPPANLPSPTSGPFQANLGNVDTADRPYSAVLVEYTGNDSSQAKGYISGAPDALIGEGPLSNRGLYQFGGWANLFLAYAGNSIGPVLGVLGQNNAAYRALNWPAPTIPPILKFTTNALAAGQIGIQMAAPLVFTLSPPSVMIKGVRKVNPRFPGLQGIYYVNQDPAVFPVAAPWIYYLQNTSQINPANLVLNSGVAAPLTYKYPIITSGLAYATTHRKRGASALAPRGRSRTRS